MPLHQDHSKLQAPGRSIGAAAAVHGLIGGETLSMQVTQQQVEGFARRQPGRGATIYPPVRLRFIRAGAYPTGETDPTHTHHELLMGPIVHRMTWIKAFTCL